MPLWDADHCVAECRRHAKRPANDTETSELDWCAYLTSAQAHWLPILATKAPESQYGAPIALTLSGDQKTASFPAGVYPSGKVELYDGLAGRRLTPGNYNDPGADFSIESDGAGGMVIRGTLDRQLSFPNGLYARYVNLGNLEILSTAGAAARGGGAVVIDPILQPPHGRELLVYHACALWASSGGYRDPSYFEHLEIKFAWDDPQTGKLGLVTQLMTQFQGQGADSEARYVWYKSPDLNPLANRLV